MFKRLSFHRTADSTWWDHMPESEQQTYLDQHPHSHKKLHPLKSLEPHQIPPHIKALAIPPNWTDVHINPDPEAALQATGRDSKNRPVYLYSAKFIESQVALKFARVKELQAKLKLISAENDANMRSADPKIRESAECLHLIIQTGIRPGGSGTKAEVKAYGATTLEGQHVKHDKRYNRGQGLTFLRFIGKKGVPQDHAIHDPVAAEIITRRAAANPGHQQLFKISDSTLAAYTQSLDGGGFRTKDFRTLLANNVAEDLIPKTKAPTNAKDYHKAVNAVATHVASRLGNDPAMALQAYINPVVFAQWQTPAIMSELKAEEEKKSLQSEQRRLKREQKKQQNV